ncbi:MAG: hypothetical protein GY940_03325 [bacterium]|nr:hypothetical protein [bacterium]
MSNVKGSKSRQASRGNRFTLFFLVFLFFFLSLPQAYLHNHPLTQVEPEDCPVFNFKRAVDFLPGIGTFLFVLFLVAFFCCRLSNETLKSHIFFTSLGSRAPPLFA